MILNGNSKNEALLEVAAVICLNTTESSPQCEEETEESVLSCNSSQLDASVSAKVLPITETTANGYLTKSIKEEIFVGNDDFEASQEQQNKFMLSIVLSKSII